MTPPPAIDPAEPAGSIDVDRARRAIAGGNIPTLLMVLFHLTGDERWLDDPYRPTRNPGLSLHDTGGLTDDAQDEVRAAVLDALTAWDGGREPSVPSPDTALLRRMLATCVGEEVAPEYAEMMHHEMRFAGDGAGSGSAVAHDVRGRADPRPMESDVAPVVIIGAGVSGLILGTELRRVGIPFVIYEKRDDVGGTWLANRYPGAGVDTPSYLYSYSRFPRNWSTHFGKRGEVLTYVRELADHFDLRRDIEFGCEVAGATYDEAAQRWRVEVVQPNGTRSTVEARYVVTAVGLLSTPAIPGIDGLDDFDGPVFHSAEWPDDLDVAGKHVAVVGSGASAMQIVPAIAGRANSLTVYQRSPQWVAPSDVYFEPVSDDVHWLMTHVPYYHRWFRFRLAWVFNDKIYDAVQVDPEWPHPERSVSARNDFHREYFTRYLRAELDGRDDLIERSLPDYPPYGKRILLDNGWYAALRRDDVELVTEPVVRLTERGVVSASGGERPADVVVLCTGFQTQRLLHPLQITGRDGATIRETWGDDDPRAYLGMTTPGFPNLFFLYGPNTNPGGGSYIFIAECQTRYLVDLLVQARQEDVGSLECRADVHDDFNRRVDEAHEGLVWSHPGMDTYFRNAAGRVVTNWPWRIVDYWHATRAADLDDFVVEPRRGGTPWAADAH